MDQEISARAFHRSAKRLELLWIKFIPANFADLHKVPLLRIGQRDEPEPGGDVLRFDDGSAQEHDLSASGLLDDPLREGAAFVGQVGMCHVGQKEESLGRKPCPVRIHDALIKKTHTRQGLGAVIGLGGIFPRNEPYANPGERLRPIKGLPACRVRSVEIHVHIEHHRRGPS